MNTSFPDAQLYREDEKLHRRHLAETINRINGGKFNAVATLTLTPNATSTTLSDSRIGGQSYIDLCPTTASAATAKPSIYIDTQLKGTAVVHHASSAATDQTFNVLIIG
jgi:hypothetical protein